MPRGNVSPEEEIGYLSLLFRLEEVKRAGWVREGIPDPQSIAEHSFGTTVLAREFAGYFPGVDRNRLFQMALFHDVGEAATGKDRVAQRWEKVDWKKFAWKTRVELSALRRENVPKQVLSLWLEYERQETPEARALREIEKFEMALQALIYERKTGKDLSEFFVSARTWLRNRHLLKLFSEILKARSHKRKRPTPP